MSSDPSTNDLEGLVSQDYKVIILQKVSEYDQEIPQLNSADQPHGTVRNSNRTFIVLVHL